MKKIVFLTTDTLHHQYFFERVESSGIRFDQILFETKGVVPPFDVRAAYEEQQNEFEERQLGPRDELWFSARQHLYTESVCDQSTVDYLNSLKADLGVVFGTRKLSEEVISQFKDGLINVHRGIAEKYRGLDSELWAIYHHDFANLGVTIHKVEPSLDTGAVLSEDVLKLEPGMVIAELRWALTSLAGELTSRVLKSYCAQGIFHSRPQEKIGRYYSFMPSVLKEEAGSKFDRYCASL